VPLSSNTQQHPDKDLGIVKDVASTASVKIFSFTVLHCRIPERDLQARVPALERGFDTNAIIVNEKFNRDLLQDFVAATCGTTAQAPRVASGIP
jgi:hypothetical protein